MINVVDPDAIVLGGGCRTSRACTSGAEAVGEFVFSDAVVTKLVRAVHGDSSGVRGAAWLWD